MTLVNGLIIYFAFGVPFGMLSVYARTSRPEPADIFRVVYHLVLWPMVVFLRSSVAGVVFFRSRVYRKAEKPSPVTGPEERLQKEYLRRLYAKQMNLKGLVEAHRQAVEAKELRFPLGDCIDHPNLALAAKCYQRRHIAKLQRSVAETQNELSEVLAGIRSPSLTIQASRERREH